MRKKQERKYNIVNDLIVNRATGRKIPENEPIIIFRAKDIKSIVALEAYRDSCEDALHREVIQKVIDEFVKFQENNQSVVREPDSDASCLCDM